jgi:hypothetical protein
VSLTINGEHSSADIEAADNWHKNMVPIVEQHTPQKKLHFFAILNLKELQNEERSTKMCCVLYFLNMHYSSYNM